MNHPKVTITIDAALARSLSEEKRRVADAAIEREFSAPEPPLTELHRWRLLSNNRIHAQLVVNHPRLGNCGPVTTGTILYLNRELRIATSARTVYILFDEVRS